MTMPTTRLIVGLAGAGLAGWGLRQRGPLRLAFITGGVAISAWALRGDRHIGIDAGMPSGTCDDCVQQIKEERTPAGQLIEDVVLEASEDSFPASDPPGWIKRNTTTPA
ncbi:MAG: hypothetical protein ACJ8C4_12430 [Gemmataceae bacterium]